MLGFFTKLLSFLQHPRADEPRMPASMTEAEHAFRRYNGLNGRYYFVADVVLEGGRLLPGVTFDGDSRIAVEYNRRPVHQQPDLIGRATVAYLISRDRSCGQSLGEASEEERKKFLSEHAGPNA